MGPFGVDGWGLNASVDAILGEVMAMIRFHKKGLLSTEQTFFMEPKTIILLPIYE